MNVTAAVTKRAFANPFELETPAGAEGWQGLYRYYALLSEERRPFEEGKFWFFDGMHNPEPLYPFDTIMTDNWWVAASQMSTRVWALPPAIGIDHRVINGYLYISPNAVTDPAKIAERAPITMRARPWRILCHSSCRSPELRCECSTATSVCNFPELNRALNRSTVCGVREISGTSTMAPLPCSSACAMACK